MILQRILFRKVTIIGVGLIGGSIGMAIKKKGLARQVVGVSAHASSLECALKNEAIDEGTQDARKSVANADCVILATPVNTILTMIDELKDHFRRGTIITDVGSTKQAIVDRAQRLLPPTVLFVGSHPLAGSEKHGPAFASANLFEQTTCIMTPTDKTNRLAKDKIKHFWTQLGATVKMIFPLEHDEILSYISHLPHVLAYAMMKAIPENFLTYAAQGLKDTTRIANSHPSMWVDICLSNPKNVLRSVDETVKILAQIRKAMVDKDEKQLSEIFQQAREKRQRLEEAV